MQSRLTLAYTNCWAGPLKYASISILLKSLEANGHIEMTSMLSPGINGIKQFLVRFVSSTCSSRWDSISGWRLKQFALFEYLILNICTQLKPCYFRQ